MEPHLLFTLPQNLVGFLQLFRLGSHLVSEQENQDKGKDSQRDDKQNRLFQSGG